MLEPQTSHVALNPVIPGARVHAGARLSVDPGRTTVGRHRGVERAGARIEPPGQAIAA